MIEYAQLKQIAGRAGRYRTVDQAERLVNSPDNASMDSQNFSNPTTPPSLGLVTSLDAADMPMIRKAMEAELDPIMSAGIFPPTSVLTKFATYFPPSTSFSYILVRLHELSLRHPRYHLCDLKDQIAIADAIQPVQNLTIHDRIVFCASPANSRAPGMRTILQAFARCVGEHSSGALLEIPEIPLGVLTEEMKVNREYMERLESLHKALILYLWLSYRFAGVFINQAMAFYVKSLVEAKIDRMLAEYSASPAIRGNIRKMREEALRQISKLNKSFAGPETSQPETEIREGISVSEDQPDQLVEILQQYTHGGEQLDGIEGVDGRRAETISP